MKEFENLKKAYDYYKEREEFLGKEEKKYFKELQEEIKKRNLEQQAKSLSNILGCKVTISEE